MDEEWRAAVGNGGAVDEGESGGSGTRGVATATIDPTEGENG